MKNNNDQFAYRLKELQKITFPEEVRWHVRAELSSHADFHPITTSVPTSRFVWLVLHRSGVAFTAAMLVVGLLGSTAYAAERSLPGDRLYSVKVRVTEPVQVALTPTAKGKAKVFTALAERRLDEVAELAVTEKLDDSTGEFLEQKFSEHVDGTLAAADKLAASGDAKGSLDARSRLESRLEAHAEILDLVNEHLDTVKEQGGNDLKVARNILDTIKLRQEVVSESRQAVERELEEKVTQTETLALVTKTDAVVPEESDTTTPTTPFSTIVAEHMEDAKEALSDAKRSLESDNQEDVGDAFRKIGQAERSSDTAATLLRKTPLFEALTKATMTPATTTPPNVDEPPATSTAPLSPAL